MQIDSIASAVLVSIECDRQVPIHIRFLIEFDRGWHYFWIPECSNWVIEIGIDPTSRAICDIDVVNLASLSDQPLSVVYPVEDIPSGLPCAALATWTDDRRYVREEQEVMASLVGDRFTLAFGDLDQPMVNSVQCDRVVFLIDQLNKLRGIEVLKLSDSEIENIRYAVRPRTSIRYSLGQRIRFRIRRLWNDFWDEWMRQSHSG